MPVVEDRKAQGREGEAGHEQEFGPGIPRRIDFELLTDLDGKSRSDTRLEGRGIRRGFDVGPKSSG